MSKKVIKNESLGRKLSRGRPRNLEPEHFTEQVMFELWKAGPASVSLNDIVKKLGVSKPSVYRDFGDFDGLVSKALIKYNELVLKRLRLIAGSESSLEQKIEMIVDYATTGGTNFPTGCLYVKSKEAHHLLSPRSQTIVKKMRSANLKAYTQWMTQERDQQNLAKQFSPKLAAQFLDAQIGSALSLLSQGMKKSDVREILTISLEVLKNKIS